MKSQIEFVRAKPKDIKGSGGVGQMTADYNTLIKAFGNPHDCTKEGPWKSGDNKVRAEWAFKSVDNGEPIVITIYDYKQSKTPVTEVTDWSIGLKGDIQIAASFLVSRLGRYCFKTHRIVLVEKRLNTGSTIMMSAEAVEKIGDC